MRKPLIASLILFCGFLSRPTLAGPTPKEIVVQVSSGLCKSDVIEFRGSGILFQHQGELFVLTSEHAVIQGNGEYCHPIWNEAIGRAEAEWLVADWGVGLALLRVKAPSSLKIEIPTIEIFGPAEVREGERVITAGYPFNGNRMIVDRNGRVLLKESRRHLMAAVDSLIEVIDGHGEYGMSGGGLFSFDETYLLGMLSHQYLEMRAGGPTRVGEFDTSRAGIKNHLLVIPNEVIAPWLAEYFRSPQTFQVTFARDPGDQLVGRNALLSAGLRFEGEDQGGGIGGADAVGIGGADQRPGDERAKEKRGGIGVRVSLGQSAAPTRWYRPGQEEWIQKLKEKLLVQNQVNIPFFVRRNRNTEEIRKVEFSSLSEFFHLLREADTEPVTLLKASLRRETEETTLERLRENGEELFGQSQTLLGKVSIEDSLRGRLILKELSLFGELLKSDHWMLLDLKMLSSVKQVDHGWEYLYNHYFDETVALYKILLQAEEDLAKVKI